MKQKNLPVLILSIIVIVGFFTLLGILIFVPIKIENKDMLNLVIGALLSAFTGVVAYWISSTSESSRKTDLLSKAEPIKEDITKI